MNLDLFKGFAISLAKQTFNADDMILYVSPDTFSHVEMELCGLQMTGLEDYLKIPEQEREVRLSSGEGTPDIFIRRIDSLVKLHQDASDNWWWKQRIKHLEDEINAIRQAAQKMGQAS